MAIIPALTTTDPPNHDLGPDPDPDPTPNNEVGDEIDRDLARDPKINGTPFVVTD